MVGALNFGVSFALALWVAFRARDVRASQQVKLLFAVLARFRARPLDFIRAPKRATLDRRADSSAHSCGQFLSRKHA